MPPNLHNFQDYVENPVRDAAIHFGAYLQLANVLKEHATDRGVGVITTTQLQDLFANRYQPKFHTCLVQPKLLVTLLQYHVVRKRSRSDKTHKLVRVVLHPHPAQVKEPANLVRARVYVDQTRVMRDKINRAGVIDENRCRLCNVSFLNEQSKELHLNSDEHTLRLQYREKRSSFKSAVDSASIYIADREVDDNEVILRTGEHRDITIKVSLGGQPYTEAKFIKIFERIDLGEISAAPLQFHSGEPIDVTVSASFEEPGAYLYPLVAKVITPKKLILLEDLVIRVESELMDQLKPTAPYVHRKENVIMEMEGSILPGEYLERSTPRIPASVFLGEYGVPGIYNKLLIHKLEKYENMSEHEEEALNRMLSLLCGLCSYKDAMSEVGRSNAPYLSPLDQDSYCDRFAVLVHLEELQQQRQIKNYDRTDQVLQRCNTKFFLQVPELAEGRPSVIRGDRVHIQFQNDKNEFIYEAIIHEIKVDGLLLGLHRVFLEDFKKLENLGKQPKVAVRFTVNRYPFRNMHRALKMIHKHKAQSILFPAKEEKKGYFPPTKKLSLRPWVNPLINSNPEQQTAVKNIVERSSGSAPYLVFGPPGTGKTVTLVEAISQVWYATMGRVVRQLVCAPSNAACNNIARKLVEILPPEAKVYRLYSMSSDEVAIPQELISHCNFDKTKGMIMPPIEKILEKHIVVVTLVTAGRLVTVGGGGHFQYVYIDECGQAVEPEALIAVSGILTTPKCTSVGQLVLAGDPQQLGPILSSQLAKDFGLGMSLLERLMNYNSLYKRREGSGYDNNFLTKLVQNFRSHPSILHIPNQMFYENELKVEGDPDIINCAVGWSQLPNPKFPLVFHGVQGKDERESNSPSYFNRQEIDVALMYIDKLLKNGLPNNKVVKQDDIGIITPYRKQVQKFRKAFSLLGWDIRVGSVEEFQGSEKLIIFISTVRSSKELIEEDYFYRLGFLKNPKRFNVSVTRAKALLVVIGNSNILWHDKTWYQFLQYCHDNRAYKGMPFPTGDPPQHPLEHISS